MGRYIIAQEGLYAALAGENFPSGMNVSLQWAAKRIKSFKAELLNKQMLAKGLEIDMRSRGQRLRSRLQARREEDGFGASWVGKWEIGGGSYGKANLWVKQNQDGVITDVSCSQCPHS